MIESDAPKRCFAARRAGVTLCFGGLLGGWLMPASAQAEPVDDSTAGNVGTHVTYRGGVFARGDENNRDANGKVPGYSLLALDTTWQATKHLQLFASVTNLLDTRYASLGMLDRNVFNGPHHSFDGLHPADEQFVGPGAPRGAWVGARYAWD